MQCLIIIVWVVSRTQLTTSPFSFPELELPPPLSSFLPPLLRISFPFFSPTNE